MSKKKKIILAIAVALLLIAAIVLVVVITSRPPELDEVKGTYIQLIEDSAEINEILFGEGLSVYEPLGYDEDLDVYYAIYTTKEHGRLCAYRFREDMGAEFSVLRFGEQGEGEAVYVDEDEGIWLYATDLEFVDSAEEVAGEAAPVGYRFVRLDERYTSINDISTAAAKVYSEDYLRDVFSMVMGDEGSLTVTGSLSAKYCETTVGYGNEAKKLLLRAETKTVEPIVTSKRIYNYDTMKMLKNSRKNFVTVEIDSYGTYVDLETNSVKVGWNKVKLSFVYENGEWRLDTPTY